MKMNVLFESINNVQKTQIHCRYLYLKYSHKVSYIPFSYETFQTVNTLRALIVVILRIKSYLRICLFAFICVRICYYRQQTYIPS